MAVSIIAAPMVASRTHRSELGPLVSLNLEKLTERPGILRCTPPEVIVKIDPGALGTAGCDAVYPFRELRLRVIVPIPALPAMQADVNFIGRFDELLRQPGRADRAEHRPCLTEGAEDFLPPPAGMPELDHVAPAMIELRENAFQPRGRIMVARRELIQKAAHPVLQQIGDDSEVTDMVLGACESFDVCDELAHLHSVDELPASRGAQPRFDASLRRP